MSKLNNLTTALSRKAHMAGFKLKKHSPEILVVTGIVGVVTSAVMACKATTKVNEILERAKEDIDAVHTYMETDEFGESYTEQEGKQALTKVYMTTGVDLVKLYAPSVILGTLSLTAILSSNNILRKRNVALAAAYTGVEKAFKNYRGRVIERFGEELDNELYYNIKQQQVEETVVNEDGSETTVTKTASVVDPNTIDETAVIYYEGCKGHTKSAEANHVFLKQQQAYANEKLKRKGYLYLNDVLSMLGLEKKVCGQVLGWVYDEKNPVGDNFVDFGLYKPHNARFLDGCEPNVLLTFNHDGYILDELAKRGLGH